MNKCPFRYEKTKVVRKYLTAKRLYKLLVEQGISIYQLSLQCGVSEYFISDLVNKYKLDITRERELLRKKRREIKYKGKVNSMHDTRFPWGCNIKGYKI